MTWQNGHQRQNSRRLTSESIAEINVTPFIDVCLVLLIIFMIVTPMILMGFNVNVPPKATDKQMEDYPNSFKNQLILTLTSEGHLSINQIDVKKEQLQVFLQDLYKERVGKKVIFFNAEDNVTYGIAVEILDIVRQAGTETIGVVTETL